MLLSDDRLLTLASAGKQVYICSVIHSERIALDSLKFTCRFRLKNHSIGFQLELLEFKDDSGFYIVNAPALELSGYGVSPNEARESFAVVLQEYLIHMTENDRLIDDLRQRNWHVSANDVIESIEPPEKYDLPGFDTRRKGATISKLKIQLQEEFANGVPCN